MIIRDIAAAEGEPRALRLDRPAVRDDAAATSKSNESVAGAPPRNDAM
jgi:hypothetical protein